MHGADAGTSFARGLYATPPTQNPCWNMASSSCSGKQGFESPGPRNHLPHLCHIYRHLAATTITRLAATLSIAANGIGLGILDLSAIMITRLLPQLQQCLGSLPAKLCNKPGARRLHSFLAISFQGRCTCP